MQSMFKLFLIYVLLIPLAHAAEEPRARMFGANIDGAMKLYWETYEWPEGLQAFNIKKKTKDNKWQKLNKDPIAPQIDTRDWTNIGLSKHQAEDFEKTYQNYISSKKLAKSPAQDLVKILAQYGGLAVGDRINLKSDFNMALIMGYGFIDSTFKDNEDTTYGVFYVKGQKKEDAEPVAIFKPQKNLVVQPTIEFKKEPNTVTLVWQVDENTYRQAAISGFNLYRMDGSTWTSLGTHVYMKTEENKFIWEEFFPVEKFNSDILFKITPITIFQSELPSITQKYEHSEFQPIPVGAVKAEQDMNDLSVKTTWDTKSLLPFKNRISKIYIARRGDITKPSDDHPISLNDSSWVDSSKKIDGEGYSYILTVVDRKNNVWKGERGFVWYKANPPQ